MSKIGFNLLAWSAGLSEEMYPIIERLKGIGYNGIEIFVGSPDEREYKKMGDFVRSTGLEVTSVMLLGAEESPIDPDKNVRQKGLEKLKWMIDRSHDLGSQLICGPFHSAHMVFAGRAPEEAEYLRSAEILHQAADYAAQAGILLVPEALNRFECYLCNTMDQLLHLIHLIDHPNVKALFDTHHANIEEKSLSAAVKTISPVLGHVHISENDRGTPGSGHVDFDTAFSALASVGYDGWFTIEGFTRNDPDFANAIGVWRNFSEPWDMAENGYKMIRSQCEKHNIPIG